MNQEPDISLTLGDLERQVFEAVRGLGPTGVAGVVATLESGNRPLAYTTIMTVLSRLWTKGYLLRRRVGKAYLYEARPEGDIAGDLGGKAAREALEAYGDIALTGFVRTLTPQQRLLVARLLSEEPHGGATR
jgi:predicted transcriptional regulator